MVAASDAAAQLVQLGEPEAVGAVDQDGVGRGDVDAGLDDGGAQQQIRALVREVAHDAFELALGHLSVAHHDARHGQQPLELFAHVLDRAHLVMDEIDLPAALEFAQHRLADEPPSGVRRRSSPRGAFAARWR